MTPETWFTAANTLALITWVVSSFIICGSESASSLASLRRWSSRAPAGGISMPLGLGAKAAPRSGTSTTPTLGSMVQKG